MSRPTRIAALAAAAALVGTLALPGLAIADDTSTPQLARTATDRVGAESTFFAGYVAPLKSDKRIVGTFTVPILDCRAKDEATAWVIELATKGGAEWVDGLVFSNCVDGVGSHDAVFHTTTEAGVVDIPDAVEDGDKIKVESEYNRGKIKITMKNMTQGWTAKGSFEGVNPEEASALAYSVELAPGEPSLPPLSENSAVKGVKVGGKDLKDAKPVKYTWVSENGKPLVQPTKITKGTDFKFNYVG